jgi:hypothetical protein
MMIDDHYNGWCSNDALHDQVERGALRIEDGPRGSYLFHCADRAAVVAVIVEVRYRSDRGCGWDEVPSGGMALADRLAAEHGVTDADLPSWATP